MRTFKDLYYVISYSLLILQIGFLCIWLYNKIVYKRDLYYGNTDNPPYEISQGYFDVLKFQLYGTFILMITWALLTPFAVISNKGSREEARIHMSKGITGFIIAIILLIIDPFGMLKWFTS
jgi:hypothetical protein